MTVLDDLAAEVAADQEAIEGDLEDTRTRVIRMGRKLRKMQKEQKKEQNQAKAKGETPIPWSDWCDQKKAHDEPFPSRTQVKRYSLISRYPKAYEKGMSIDQAYRAAGQWKKNGGNPPIKEKKTVSDPLLRIQKAAGQLERKIETICNQIAESSVVELAERDGWDDDIIAGTRDACDEARKACLMMVRQLDGIYEGT